MKPLNLTMYKVVPGRHFGTPKELWGFRARPGKGSPAAIARDFLKTHAHVLGLDGIRSGLRLRRMLESLGAHHVILQQVHRHFRIHRAYITVHIDRSRRVYLVKNRAVPAHLLPSLARFPLAKASACRRALRSLPKRVRIGRIMGVERVWCSVKGQIRTAFRVRVWRDRPAEEWLVYVDASTGTILSKHDNLALARGRATVFDPNPVAALGDWRPLLADGRRACPPDEAYVKVRLEDLQGQGFLDGRRVSTRLTRRRVRRPDHRFLLRSMEHGFEEVMVYHHLDRAVRYIESLGYRGRRAIFRDSHRGRCPGNKGRQFLVQSGSEASDLRHRRSERR